MRLNQRREAQAQAPAASQGAHQGRKAQNEKHAALLKHVALTHDERRSTADKRGHDAAGHRATPEEQSLRSRRYHGKLVGRGDLLGTADHVGAHGVGRLRGLCGRLGVQAVPHEVGGETNTSQDGAHGQGRAAGLAGVLVPEQRTRRATAPKSRAEPR